MLAMHKNVTEKREKEPGSVEKKISRGLFLR
jgi:hypothetical protein